MRFQALAAVLALAIASPAVARQAAPVAPTEIMVGDRLPGSFFAKPAGAGPFPAVILLGGSEGNDGSARRKAPLFLEQGYAVLGMPYYSLNWASEGRKFPELPAAFADIAVEQAGIAREWFAARDDVASDAIGIYGVSRGAEFALLAGSLIDGFAAIAAIVPTDVVWEGWGAGRGEGVTSSFSFEGEPLPFVPYIGMRDALRSRTRLRLPHDAGRHAFPERAVAARIRVEDIDEPVLVAGGDADDVWNSGEMAQAIAERRAAAGLRTVSLIYTDAGHSLSGTGAPDGWGNDAEKEAQRKIWPTTLAFFAQHLKNR